MNCDEKLNSDERDGCRSLLCDTNGIIIAEMVYRCMRCSNVNDYMGEARKHYHDKHMDKELNCNNNYLPIESKKSRDDSENWNCNGKLVDSCSKKRGSNGKAKVSSSTPTESCTRSGYITCPVCSSTRFYTTLQRRYGQFTCVACYRFFKEFFINPTKYSCNNLGKCPLDVKSKCKACWINSCSKTYSVDERRKTILEANRPYKNYQTPDSSSTSSLSPSSVQLKQEREIKIEAEPEEEDEDAFESYDEEDNGDSEQISTGDISCCLQCTNCLAEDCGTCVNCIDRPRIEGSFPEKRCVNKKCLNK